jgi:hypothetical protein
MEYYKIYPGYGIYLVYTRYMSVLYLEVGAAAADMAPFLPIHPQ